MPRPVTIFSGQWADLPFEEACRLFASMGYDGVEIATWGDHMNVRECAENPAYAEERKAILARHGLKCFALGSHLTGQCVGDLWDARLDGFAPSALAGQPERIRAWAVEEMKWTARAAKAMGAGVVTGFMGSPIWKYWYSFPQTSEKMVEDGFDEIVRLWSPIFDVFDECSVRFALEVHPTEIAFDIASAERAIAAVGGNKRFGFNYDPSHLAYQGVDYIKFIRQFADRIYNAHMKDVWWGKGDGTVGVFGGHTSFGDARRNWDFRSVGRGMIDFESIIVALNDSGPW